MKKILTFIFGLFISLNVFAEDIIVPVDTAFNLNEVTVTSLYRNNVNVGYLLDHDVLVANNYGQEPSNLFKYMPNIFAMSDNGTEFGYGYFRIRGLDQTRINVTLDGMPWNEAEDYGTYFANSPDLMSSLHSIKVERGTSSTNNGTASSGGSINLESIDLYKDTQSYGYIGVGSFNTYKTSIVYNSGLIGKSAFHIKATQQQTDGYKDYSFNNSQAFTLKYGYLFNDKHSIDVLSLNGRHRNGQGWIGTTRFELKDNKYANGNTKAEDDEWFQSVNKIQYKGILSQNLILTSSIYLQYQKGWYNFDLDNYMVRLVDKDWEQTNILYSYGLKHYLYGGNAALKYSKDNLSLTFGSNLYWYQREHYMDNRLDNHFKNVDPSEYYDNTGYKKDFNIFGAVSYTWNKFNFGANIQYRHVDFHYTDHMDNTMSFDSDTYDTNWNFINWGANIEYKITNNSKAYIRYAVAHREPTRTDMFGGNEFFIGNITTNQAEVSNDIEVGYEVNTNKIKANVNFYYMYFNNERVLNGQYGLNGLPLHDTADKSYRTGIEASIDWNFFDNLHYVFNGSVSRNKIHTDTFGDKDHILTPYLTLNNEVYYKRKNYKVGINNLYHSDMYYNMLEQTSNTKIPYYTIFNIYGQYRYKNIELGARINNIFNRINYYNATDGAVLSLWFRESGTNIFGDVKFYF